MAALRFPVVLNAEHLESFDRRSSALAGKHALNERQLFPPWFMQRSTDFESFRAMQAAAPTGIEPNADIDELSPALRAAWEFFVRERTEFPSWERMVHEAAFDWIRGQFFGPAPASAPRQIAQAETAPATRAKDAAKGQQPARHFNDDDIVMFLLGAQVVPTPFGRLLPPLQWVLTGDSTPKRHIFHAEYVPGSGNKAQYILGFVDGRTMTVTGPRRIREIRAEAIWNEKKSGSSDRFLGGVEAAVTFLDRVGTIADTILLVVGTGEILVVGKNALKRIGTRILIRQEVTGYAVRGSGELAAVTSTRLGLELADATVVTTAEAKAYARSGGKVLLGSSRELAVHMSARSQGGGAVRWSKAAYKKWFSSLKTRAPRGAGAARAYQIAKAGAKEYLIKSGGVEFWADGIRGTVVLEAKHVGDLKRGPYVLGSAIPDVIRKRILKETESEFARLIQIIADPSNPLKSVEIITNVEAAKPLFKSLLQKYNLPGRVVVDAL